ncbi:MAG: ABC transporter substrate-binding protein [Desulfococcaceae bacterium]
MSGVRKRIPVLLGMGLVFAMLFSAAVWAGTVKDLSDREIAVEKPFVRIISLYGAHTENLFSLGLDKEIIGVSANESFPPEALTRQVFSYHDDAEKFMAVKPDLVLTRPMIDRAYKPFVEKLEQSGITVVSLQPVGAGDMYEYWRNLGILTGREAAAEKMISMFQKAVQEAEERIRSIAPEKRKRVYFEAIHSKMKTFSKDSMSMFVLRTAGGINIAEDASQMRQTNIAAYGKERILAKAGEIDVFLAQHGTMNPVSVEVIVNEPGFQVIKAIRNKEVYLIDELLVSRPTLRLTEGIRQISRMLYPDFRQIQSSDQQENSKGRKRPY